MSDELTDEDPFEQDENEPEEDLITEPMVRKATYLIHKLSDKRGEDFRDIQKKCKNLFGYKNLAKVSLEEGHAIINKLIELTGGEEAIPLSTKPETAATAQPTPAPESLERTKIIEKDDLVTSTMRKSIRAAVNITLKEVVDKDVPVQGLGGFVLEIGKVIFEAKMEEEASE